MSAAAAARAGRCFACGAADLAPFFRAERLPVHSVLLMESAAEAKTYPTGALELAFCGGCGFIENVRFDPTVHEYSPRYEETQHFSPRFAAWAEGLARRLVATYDLRGKRILEVGSGKGEFLELLTRLGGNQGAGIDPGSRPERLPAQALARLTLHRERFARGFRPIAHDFFVCRHTLEHIQDVREFAGAVRDYVAPGTKVFFEVPDTARVLEGLNFEDVYYEHCSYFTAGSLARLFRAAGFRILELERDFAGQYLWLVAEPAAAGAPPAAAAAFALEEPLPRLAAAVAAFERDFARKAASWRERVQGYARAGRRPVIWGGGSKCVSFFSTLGLGPEIAYVVDVNPHKQGRFLPGTGHPVVAPEFLATYRPGVVILMNPVYRDEIAAALGALGVAAEIVAV